MSEFTSLSILGVDGPVNTVAREEWEKCHDSGAVESYRKRAELTDRLKQLSQSQPSEEETRIIYYEDENKRYLAEPMTLALILEEYQLAEDLLDAGYGGRNRFEMYQVLSQRSDVLTGWSYREISHAQLLVARSVMPETLFDKMCSYFVNQKEWISIWEDFFGNPFLEPRIDWGVLNEEIPNFRGLDRIYDRNPRLLDLFLSKKSLEYETRNRLPQFENSLKQMVCMRLFKYVADSESNIHRLFWMQSDYMKPLLKLYNSEASLLKLWIKQMHKLQMKCRNSEPLQRTMFLHLMDAVYSICATRFIKTRIHRKILDQLSLLISLNKPKTYTFADYLGYVVQTVGREDTNGDSYIDYLKAWEYCVKEPMKIRRTNRAYWNMIDSIAGIKVKDKDPSCVYLDDREYRKGGRLMSLSELFDLPIEFAPTKRIGKTVNEKLMNLFSILADYESEALMVSCIRQGIFPVRELPRYIDIAIEQKKLKLVPVMLAYQAMWTEKKKT